MTPMTWNQFREEQGRYLTLGFGPTLIPPHPVESSGNRGSTLISFRGMMPFRIKGFLLHECEGLDHVWINDLKTHKNSVLLSSNPVPARSLLKLAEQLRYEDLHVDHWIALSVTNIGSKELIFGGLFYGTTPQ
jgi:hypothetical protein